MSNALRTSLSRSGLVIASLLAIAATGCPNKKKPVDDDTASDDKTAKKKADSDDSKKKSKKGDDDDGDKKKKHGTGEDKADKKSDDDGDKATAKAGEGCKIPDGGEIKTDFTITKGCTIDKARGFSLREGATLTIEEGVKLSFEDGAVVNVDYGKLIAKGTADAPIVFTSSNKSPGKGDWGGVIFRTKTMNGTVLDHVDFEYAGKAVSSGAHVILFDGQVGAGRVAITNCSFTQSASEIVHIDYEKASFAKFDHNTMKDNETKWSMAIPANIVGSIGEGNAFEDPVALSRDVSTTATWPKLDVPYVIDGHISISSEKEALSLTIAEGTTLKFLAGAALLFGQAGGSGLTAKNVKFTSASPTPAAGDWSGLLFFDKTTATNIEGCTFEYAGKGSSWGAGVINFVGVKPAKLKAFKMTKTMFLKIDDPAIRADDADCGELDDKPAGNIVDTGKLCAKET